MGHQTKIYGYIELPLKSENAFKKYLDAFTFDEMYPFVNNFSEPNSGYINSIVSFATSLKMGANEFSDWESKFDTFLSGITLISATVVYEVDESENRKIDYIYDGEVLHKLVG